MFATRWLVRAAYAAALTGAGTVLALVMSTELVVRPPVPEIPRDPPALFTASRRLR
jgi:hypothetical protein